MISNKFILLVIFFSTISATPLETVYRFGQNRQRINSSQFYGSQRPDFDEEANCVRLDSEPISIPKEFTWCTWYYLDVIPTPKYMNMVFFDMTSSSKGPRSWLEEFYMSNKSWGDIRAQVPTSCCSKSENNGTLVHLMSFYLYGGDKPYSRWGWWPNLLRNIPPVMHKWQSVCIGQNRATGYVVLYHDGEIVEETEIAYADGRETYEDHLKATFSPSSHLATDIFIGCQTAYWWYWNSFGRITRTNWFSRILSHNEMVQMTTCSGTRLKGDLINWDTAAWTVHGSDVQKILTPMEEICPQKNFGALYIPARISRPDAYSLCRKLGGQVISIRNEEDMKNATTFMSGVSWKQYAAGFGTWNGEVGFWSTLEDLDLDQAWVNHYTGELADHDLVRWAAWFPDSYGTRRCSTFSYYHGDPRFVLNVPGWPEKLYQQETVLLKTTTHQGIESVVCSGGSPGYSRLVVRLRGLCPRTDYDTDYVWAWERVPGYGTKSPLVFMGMFNGTIEFSKSDNTWKIIPGRPSSTGSSITVYATEASLALGTHRVLVDNDPCTQGMKDKHLTITISYCKEDQFTCSDGHCVSLDQRCNNIADCPDLSDEVECTIVSLGEDYMRDYAPVSVDQEYEIIKVPVNVSVDILEILSVDEKAGTLDISFQLSLTWYDPRITFVNLKTDANLNTLTEVEKADVWKPVLLFQNTKHKLTTVTDDDVLATVARQGSFTVSGIEDPVHASFFTGQENPLTFSRTYNIPFTCQFDLAWFPFDSQECTMVLRPRGNSGEYVFLHALWFTYLGQEDLSVYYIKDFKYMERTSAGIKEVKGNKHRNIPHGR